MHLLSIARSAVLAAETAASQGLQSIQALLQTYPKETLMIAMCGLCPVEAGGWQSCTVHAGCLHRTINVAQHDTTWLAASIGLVQLLVTNRYNITAICCWVQYTGLL